MELNSQLNSHLRSCGIQRRRRAAAWVVEAKAEVPEAVVSMVEN